MTPLDSLLQTEEIKKLKARYCRLLDAKDWPAWRGLFTDDFVSDTSPAGGKRIAGADAFVAFVSGMLKQSRTTVHMVHAPEIEVSSATGASGTWMLEDLVKFAPGVKLRAYGHYAETYRNDGDGWLIASSTLTRVRQDLQLGFVSFQLPSRRNR